MSDIRFGNGWEEVVGRAGATVFQVLRLVSPIIRVPPDISLPRVSNAVCLLHEKLFSSAITIGIP